MRQNNSEKICFSWGQWETVNKERRIKKPITITGTQTTNELHTNSNEYKINMNGKADFYFVGPTVGGSISGDYLFFIHRNNISLNNYETLVKKAFSTNGGAMNRWSDKYSFSIWNSNSIQIFLPFRSASHMKFAIISLIFCWKVNKKSLCQPFGVITILKIIFYSACFELHRIQNDFREKIACRYWSTHFTCVCCILFNFILSIQRLNGFNGGWNTPFHHLVRL